MIWCTLLPLRLRDARSRHLLNFQKILHFPFSSIHFHQLAVSGYRLLKRFKRPSWTKIVSFKQSTTVIPRKRSQYKYWSDISLRTQASAKENTKYKFRRQIKEENNQKVLQKNRSKNFSKTKYILAVIVRVSAQTHTMGVLHSIPLCSRGGPRDIDQVFFLISFLPNI